MSFLTVPTNPLNFYTRGDIDVFTGSTVDNGDGTIYVRDGGLYIDGLSDLNQTTIDTTTGVFNVLGTNNVVYNMTSAISLTATASSLFTTTAGTLTFSATDTGASGKILVQGDGTGADTVKIFANNATSGQVNITSSGGSTTVNPVKILATDTTNGNILIQGSGNMVASNPAVYLLADNATSGQIRVSSAGASTTVDAIQVLATDTTDGNILIQGSGNNAGSNPAIKLYTDNATSGKIQLVSDGAITDAVQITASAGGVDVNATDLISIETTDTTDGVKIATETSGVPVTIGTSTSLTTISGDLIVQGTTTTVNTETLTVKDNIINLNSGNGELDLDSGIVVRRFQTPNDAGTGNVVNNPNPIQEQGTFQTGSATPGTLVLSAFASSADDFYNGWWIKVTSGAGNNQVRRIKTYVGSTQTATLYVTADNTAPVDGPGFTDGLDLATAPASGDSYRLYSAPFVSTFYDESEKSWNFASTALIPDPISGTGTSGIGVQQYFDLHSGRIDVHSKVYNNVNGTASGTTITFTVIGHGLVSGSKIYVENSAGFTPAIPTQTYPITSLSANTFSITVASSTTDTDASATLTFFTTSVLKANVIEPHDSAFGGLAFTGFTTTEDIIIPKTSTADFDITSTNTYGAYLVVIIDLNNTNGAYTIAATTSAGSGGAATVLSQTKGADNQRIGIKWTSTNKVQIYHAPAGSGGGNYTYRVRLITVA